jgi:hypothetical protein
MARPSKYFPLSLRVRPRARSSTSRLPPNVRCWRSAAWRLRIGPPCGATGGFCRPNSDLRALSEGQEVIIKNAAAGDGHTDTVHC